MAIPYAEVIGDPVAHSRSPLIHGFWLEKLGLRGEYRRSRVTPRHLPGYLEEKRRDTCWRGCSVTAPLKEVAAGLVGAPPAVCGFVGAVNCITRTPLSCLVGTNTDLAGINEALRGVTLSGAHICLIGAGGAAKAALCYLLGQKVGQVTIAVRDPRRAEHLKTLAPGIRVELLPLEAAAAAIAEAALVINATPLGMAGGPPMPGPILGALRHSAARTAFDMVYAPEETSFLKAAQDAGMTAVGGLAMLIGQAAPAFELFFGAPAPRQHDSELLRLLGQ